MDRVLVALDASPRAPAVLAYASQLVKKTAGRLVLFRAVGLPVDIRDQVFTVSPDQMGPLLLDQAREQLRALAVGVPEGVVDAIDSGIGTPWQAICEAATHHGADLIVVGSHGYGALDRVLGTTAAKVVNHANCPVLVVRNPEAHPV